MLLLFLLGQIGYTKLLPTTPSELLFRFSNKFKFISCLEQNTIERIIAFFPAVGRLNCHSTYIDHQGFWQMNGYGLLAVYKSDWIRFGGKFKENRYFNTVTVESRDIHVNIFLAPIQK